MRSSVLIARTAAPFLWAAFIFYLSDFPNLSISSGWSDAWFRIAAHAGEYAVLAILVFQALQVHLPRRSVLDFTILAVVCSVLYALSDEWHQSFVPTRQASVSDVLTDTAGSMLGVYIWVRFRDHYHKTA